MAGRGAEAKFREMILYLCGHSENDPWFGATKLNKLLFFSDLVALTRLGRTISGQEYQKLQHGPAPRRIIPVLERMERDGEILTRQEPVFDYPQKKTIALREPDLSVFSEEEIQIMDEVVQRLWGKNGTEVSNMSHKFLGWQVVDEGQTIPLGAVFISKRPLTEAEKAYAKELVSAR